MLWIVPAIGRLWFLAAAAGGVVLALYLLLSGQMTWRWFGFCVFAVFVGMSGAGIAMLVGAILRLRDRER